MMRRSDRTGITPGPGPRPAPRGPRPSGFFLRAVLLLTLPAGIVAQEHASPAAANPGVQGVAVVDSVTRSIPSAVRIHSYRGQDIRIIRRVPSGGRSGAVTGGPAGPAGLSRRDLDETEARIIRAIRESNIRAGRATGGGSADISLPNISSVQTGRARVETVYVERTPVPADPASTGPAVTAPPVVSAPAETVTVTAPAPTVLIKEVERSILEKGLFTALDVIFEFNKSSLMPRSFVVLNAIGSVLGEHPEIDIVIEGHTDSIGSAAYNLRLSELRAASTRDYLLKNFPAITPERIDSRGFGLTRPVADNANETGRALNRRVEFRVTENRGRR